MTFVFAQKTFDKYPLRIFIMLFLVILLTRANTTHAADVLTAREFQLIGPNGRMTAQLTTSQEGTPAFFLYDSSGKVKLNLAIYPDGAPGIILFDNHNQAAALLRLTDNNGHPVLVFKENGQDKMIVGLHNQSVIKPGNVLSSLPSLSEIIITAIIGLIAGFIGSKFGYGKSS